MRRFRTFVLILLVAALVVFFLRAPILTVLGSYLVKAEPPKKAELIVVLAGDTFGRRIVKAAQLVQQGYAPKALISGPSDIYGYYECDLAIPFAVHQGFPESDFLHFEHRARSTAEESQFVSEKLREMGVTHVLLVTSNYHTRRAGKLFRRAVPGVEVTVVAAPDEYYTPDGWWHSREAAKIFAYEWMKTIVEW